MTQLTTLPRTQFASPDDQTAPEPPEVRGMRRDDVRMMVAAPEGIDHLQFHQIGDRLNAGDVLVINTSGTLPGQLDGESSIHGQVVVHIANRLNDGTRVVELRSAPSAGTPIRSGRWAVPTR